MNIFFDQGVPAPLRTYMSEYSVDTAFEKGWHQLKNGDLLNHVEQSHYDIFITTDQNLKYQQSLAHRKVSIIVLSTTSWPKIKLETRLIIEAVNRANSNSFEEIIIGA